MTIDGNIWILVIIDVFTKWCEIHALKDSKSETIANALMDSICRLGPPEVLISDRARNLNGTVINGVCELLECDKWKSTSYRSMTDGASKRFIQTLNGLLAHVISEQQTDWDQKLKYCAFAFQTAVCEATGFSPYRLTYGRTAHLPIENWLSIPTRRFWPDYQEFVTELKYDLAKIFKRAMEKIVESKERQATQYNQKATDVSLKVGEYVYLQVKQFPAGKQKKWLPKYIRPFQIKELCPLNAIIETSGNHSQRKIVHMDRLHKSIAGNYATDYCIATPPEYMDKTQTLDKDLPNEEIQSQKRYNLCSRTKCD